MNKKELRKQMRERRDAMAAADAAAHSRAIEQRVLQLPIVGEARAIFVYVSIGNEVHTHGLIRAWLAQGKTVCVPVIDRSGDAKRMFPCRIASFDDLQPDAKTYGILSPVNPSPHTGGIDLCIMPGVAFTVRGDRLGMGAGFYDRHLAANPDMQTIAVAHDWQVIDEVPHDEHDQRVGMIATEQRLIDCAAH